MKQDYHYFVIPSSCIIICIISLPCDRALLIKNNITIAIKFFSHVRKVPKFLSSLSWPRKKVYQRNTRPAHPPSRDDFADVHICRQQWRSTTKYARLWRENKYTWRENQSIIDDYANARLSLDTSLFVGHVLRTLTHKANFGAHYVFESFYFMPLLSNHKTINKSLCMLLFLFLFFFP